MEALDSSAPLRYGRNDNGPSATVRNHYGLVKATQGDENGGVSIVIPAPEPESRGRGVDTSVRGICYTYSTMSPNSSFTRRVSSGGRYGFSSAAAFSSRWSKLDVPVMTVAIAGWSAANL